MQLDLVAVRAQPVLSMLGKVVRRSVVDDEEELRSCVLRDELLQINEESFPVEDVGEAVREIGLLFEGQRPVHVCGLAKPERVDARLNANARPCLVERAVEPEAGFIFEGYEAATCRSFFLIAGSCSRSQSAWRSASARAKRLRGRWTENPILFRSRGT